MSDPKQPPADEPHIDIEQLIHHTDLPHTRLSDFLDRIVKRSGDVVSWIWVVLVAVIVTNVTMRYVFGEGRIEFEELQWHLYALGFLVGLSYAIQNDSHIRIDILHDHFKPRTKAWIDLIGIIVFLFPFSIIVLWFAPNFIIYAFETMEASSSPGGLPYRFIVKSFLFLGFALILIAAFSRVVRAWALLFGGAELDEQR